MTVTEIHKRSMPVEHARCLFNLCLALDQKTDESQTDHDEMDSLRQLAEDLVKGRHADAKHLDGKEGYDRYIPIFWR